MSSPPGKESEAALGATTSPLDAERLWELIQAGRGLVAELDMERLIGELLDVARRVTGARYAAVGILDERRTELERFITRGIDADLHREIGDLPRGRGILGMLIADPKPLRLRRIGDHPKSYGFPPAHPPMRSFLGVPILLRNEAFGNLYLTDKEGGEFDGADEQAAVILAAWAAIAVENARLYGEASAQRDELERANRGLEAITTVARAVGAETDLEVLLDLVVKRARALVDARTLVVWLQQDDELIAAAHAGEAPPHGTEARIPLIGSVSGEVARSGRGERIIDAGAAPLARRARPRSEHRASRSPAVPWARVRRDGGLRPPRGRAPVLGRGRGSAEELRGQRGDGGCERPVRCRPTPASADAGRRAGTPAVGARAARRDASGPGEPRRRPRRRTADRRPGDRGGGHRRRRRPDPGGDPQSARPHHAAAPSGARRVGDRGRNRRSGRADGR